MRGNRNNIFGHREVITTNLPNFRIRATVHLEDSGHELITCVPKVVPVRIAVDTEEVTKHTNKNVAPLPDWHELKMFST